MNEVTLTLPANAPPGTTFTAVNTGVSAGWIIQGDGASVQRKELLLMYHDLSHPAYKMPVKELVDLWITRYGNDWVDAAEVEDDPFYKHVHNRLRQLGQLEQHYLTDRNKYVCRRPE